MFTGLIQEKGEIIANAERGGANRLVIKSSLNEGYVGESIAVNGVCLTLLPNENGHLSFDVSSETLALTHLGALKLGDMVNLERALLAFERFGGHYVSGHVDTTAVIQSMTLMDNFCEMLVGDLGKRASLHLLPKGSITLDGVSLTINDVKDDRIKVMLIPHTLAKTTFGHATVGQRVNVEFDYLTRIVAHQLKIAGQLKDEVER